MTGTSSTSPAPRQTGTIKFFDPRRGFGFIKCDDGSKDVFLSINRLRKDERVLPDAKCSFTVGYRGDKPDKPFAQEFSLL